MTVQYFNQRGFTILNNNANDRNEKEQHLTDKYVTNIKKKEKMKIWCTFSGQCTSSLDITIKKNVKCHLLFLISLKFSFLFLYLYRANLIFSSWFWIK